jgi:hypothetical protein
MTIKLNQIPKKGIEIFFLLLKSNLEIKDIIVQLNKDKLERLKVYKIRCKKCNEINFREYENLHKKLFFSEKNKKNILPDLRCKCRQRLLIREKKKLVKNYKVGYVNELPTKVYQSTYSKTKKILDLLLQLHLIKETALNYSINFSGVFMYIPSPYYRDRLGKKGKRKVNMSDRDKRCGQSLICSDLFRSFFNHHEKRDIFHNFSDIFSSFSRELGRFHPWEFREMFKGTSKISSEDLELLFQLQEECNSTENITEKQMEKLLLAKYNPEKYDQLKYRHARFQEKDSNIESLTPGDIIWIYEDYYDNYIK